MEVQLAIAALNIMLSLAENVTTNALAKQIIVYAENVLPMLIQTAADEVPVVMQIVKIFKNKGLVAPEDIANIDKMIVDADIDVDAAVADFNKRAHPNG